MFNSYVTNYQEDTGRPFKKKLGCSDETKGHVFVSGIGESKIISFKYDLKHFQHATEVGNWTTNTKMKLEITMFQQLMYRVVSSVWFDVRRVIHTKSLKSSANIQAFKTTSINWCFGWCFLSGAAVFSAKRPGTGQQETPPSPKNTSPVLQCKSKARNLRNHILMGIYELAHRVHPNGPQVPGYGRGRQRSHKASLKLIRMFKNRAWEPLLHEYGCMGQNNPPIALYSLNHLHFNLSSSIFTDIMSSIRCIRMRIYIYIHISLCVCVICVDNFK